MCAPSLFQSFWSWGVARAFLCVFPTIWMPVLWKLKRARCSEPVKIVKSRVPRIWFMWKKKILPLCPRARLRRQALLVTGRESPDWAFTGKKYQQFLLEDLVWRDFLIWISVCMIVRVTKVKNNSFIFTYAIHYLQNIFLHLFRYYFLMKVIQPK